MTVPSSTSRDQQTGNGVTVAFTVPFRILDQSHLRVLLTIAGVTTEQTLTTHYSVSGVGGSSTTVTFVTAPANGAKVTFLRNVPLTQETDYVPNDPFPAESHERALDKLTMQLQQLNELAGENGRTIKIPAEVSGVSTELPTPVANGIWAWNEDADAPAYLTPGEIATFIAFANWQYETFAGTGAQTAFTLSSSPASIGNMDVSIDGVTQVPGTDYTLLGTSMDFVAAPADGAVILVRYGTAVAQGVGSTMQATEVAVDAGDTTVVVPGIASGAIEQVYYNGVFQNPSSYSVAGSTITFTEALPVAGKVVAIVADGAFAGSIGSGNIGHTALADGAVTRTVRETLDELPLVAGGEFGVAGDGATNDTAAFEAWIDALQSRKKRGHVPRGTYLIDTIRRRELTVDLRIVCDPDAVFVGSSTLQEFPGDGADTTFTVTTFDAGANGFRVAHISSGGVETLLIENTGYTVAGQIINTAAGSAPFGAVAVGDKLRVVSANAMVELGSATDGGCGIDWQGGYFDASARGYATNTGAGSGIVFYNTRRGSCRDAYFYASDDWETAIAAGLGGDSGLTTINCDNFKIESCVFEGWGDLGVYATGDSSTGEADDGFGVDIDNCGFMRCQSAASVKRGGQASHIHNCWAIECHIGFSFFPAGTNPDGARGSIHDNYGRKIGRIFIDCRSTKGVSVHDNTCIDIGFKPDGVTATTTPTGINFLGVDGGIIHDNVIMLQDWATASQRGINFGQDLSYAQQTSNSRAHHNKIRGMGTGVLESGAGTGNAFDENEVLSCTTPYNVTVNARGSYHDGTNRYDIVAGTARLPDGTYTPTLTNQTNVAASTAYACQYSLVGKTVSVSGKVEITCTANSVATELRLSLPIGTTFTADEQLAGTANPGDVTGAGANGAFCKAEIAGSTCRLRYTAGAAATSSRTWFFHFTYRIQ